jgi:hypothetical protein
MQGHQKIDCFEGLPLNQFYIQNKYSCSTVFLFLTDCHQYQKEIIDRQTSGTLPQRRYKK